MKKTRKKLSSLTREELREKLSFVVDHPLITWFSAVLFGFVIVTFLTSRFWTDYIEIITIISIIVLVVCLCIFTVLLAYLKNRTKIWGLFSFLFFVFGGRILLFIFGEEWVDSGNNNFMIFFMEFLPLIVLAFLDDLKEGTNS